MDIMEALHTRRSIRKYTDQPVSDEAIRAMLGAAMTAPSAGNQQPWQFIVVRDRELLSSVKEFSPYAAMAAHAPLGILVCGDLSLNLKYPSYWVQDCTAAVENLLLAAHGLGLGAVWTGVHTNKEREDGFRKMFDLPAGIEPLAFLVIGHPEHPGEYKDRYNDERVHYDNW